MKCVALRQNAPIITSMPLAIRWGASF